MWLDSHKNRFQQLKRLLTFDMMVRPFDPPLPSFLVTDAFRLYGLGCALLQKKPSGFQRVIKCGSCSLIRTQDNYTTIELECLAIVWAIKKCHVLVHEFL